MASCSIRAHVDALDARDDKKRQQEPKVSEFQFNNVYLGSREEKSVSDFVRAASGDAAFTAFQHRLKTCVNRLREQEGQHSIDVDGADKVSGLCATLLVTELD